MNDRLLLSIVITSYTVDRLKDIYDLLDSVKTQTYTNIELIFVAERSEELRDKVSRYAQENGIDNMTTIFHEGMPGLSEARNAGMRKASGDIIAFVDDDVVLLSDWAKEMIGAYKDDSIIGVTGPALPLWKGDSLPWFPEEFYWVISCTAWCNVDEVTEVRNGWGHNMSFKKEAFAHCQFEDSFGRTKGFDKEGKKGPVGDDTEFCINLKTKSGKIIIYSPRVKVYHKVYSYKLTSRFIRRQAYWQGYTKAMFRRLYDRRGENERLLNTEYKLLKRVLFNLFPSIIIDFFHHPRIAWKRLRLSITVLFHLAVGFFSATWSCFGKLTRKAYST